MLFSFNSKYLPKYEINIKCDQILHKKAFDICYNYKWKTPKIVIYRLYKKLINKNNYSRKNLRFKPDYNIPIKFRSYNKDYSKTGYDRGHLAPNGAFDYNKTIQKETFLLSNIAPQKPRLNRKLWAKIERFTRFQAIKYKKISVITGVCKSLGKIKNNINIPKWWYKIIFIPNGKIISFLVPNSNYVGKDKIRKYLVDFKEIEKKCNFKIR